MPYFNYKKNHIHYEVRGSGTPLVFLHGNTASSKMFYSIINHYSEEYMVITIDFLGHGKSDRVEEFPQELWFDEALQTITLLDFLRIGPANLLGSSGGAWVAINVALERPDLVSKVIADSFDGRTLAPGFAERLLKNRAQSKQDEMAKQFYLYCQGNDWESVVDHDTKSLLKLIEENGQLFHKSIKDLIVPILLTASHDDDLIRQDFDDEYDSIIEIVPFGQKHIFSKGFHPAVISNDISYARVVKEFLNDL